MSKRRQDKQIDIIAEVEAVAQFLAVTDTVKPPKGVQEEAALGLEWRLKHKRGGTMVGVARARDLSGGRAVSYLTLKRMKAYFDRHEVDLQGEGSKPGEPGYPSAGLIAWKLWGGDSGRTWALSELRKAGMLDKEGSIVPR
jgi:hypothetical protein